MSTTANLTNYARFLRNASPKAFDDFLAAFALYRDERVNDLLKATENLPSIQGQVQQCIKILRALEEAKNNG